MGKIMRRATVYLLAGFLYTALLIAATGCSDTVSQDDEPAHGDVGVDAATTDPVVGSPSLLGRPAWRQLDGPPGGIGDILRIADTVYLLDGRFPARDVVGVSTDFGRAWRGPNASGVDALIDGAGAVVAQIGGTSFLLRESVLYARNPDGTWRTVRTTPVRSGRLVATDGKLIAAGRSKLMVSEDGGQSWTVRDGPPNWFGYELFAWNGAVFTEGGDELSVSRDFGASWELHSKDFSKPAMEDWIDAGSQIVAIEPDEDGPKLATSNDGINWHMVPIQGTDSALTSLVMTDEGLLGITLTGAVGRMGWDGVWSEMTPGPWQFLRRLRELVAAGEALIGVGYDGVAHRWTERSGWRLIDAGQAATGQLVGDGRSMWVQHRQGSSFQVFWQNESGWRATEAAGSHVFAVDGELYSSIGLNDCLYRLRGLQWELNFQWRPNGPSPVCDNGSDILDGWISGMAQVGGQVFVSYGGELDDDFLVDFNARNVVPIDIGLERGVAEFGSDGTALWIRSQRGDVYERTEEGFVDRTPTRAEANLPADSPVSVRQLETAENEVYAVIGSFNRYAENIRVLRRRDNGWELLPTIPNVDLRADEHHRVISATKSGLFSLNDDSVWYYSTLHRRWFALAEGFPDDYIRDLEATETAVYVSARRTGIWKLEYRR